MLCPGSWSALGRSSPLSFRLCRCGGSALVRSLPPLDPAASACGSVLVLPVAALVAIWRASCCRCWPLAGPALLRASGCGSAVPAVALFLTLSCGALCGPLMGVTRYGRTKGKRPVLYRLLAALCEALRPILAGAASLRPSFLTSQ